MFGFDFLEPPKINAMLSIASIHHESIKFEEEGKFIHFEVTANLNYVNSNKVLFREPQPKKFLIFLRGETDYKKEGFEYKGIIFFDTEYSKIIKEELNKISMKYFADKLEKKTE